MSDLADLLHNQIGPVLDAVQDNIAIMGPDLSILFANKATADHFKSTRQELKGRKCYTVFQPRNSPCEDCPVVAALKTGKPASCRKTSDTSGADFEIYAAPLSFQGEVFGAMEFARDVSARSRIEDSERRAQELLSQLQKALAARDEFLSIASHELKTPLTALRLQTDLLTRLLTRTPEDVPRERIIESLRRTRADIDRLTGLIDDLLDVTRISARKLALTPETFDLVELGRDVADRFDYAIAFEAPPSLPGCWDRGRIDQVLTNLLSNAVKYGAKKPVALVLRLNGPLVEIAVRDQGIGIPPEHHGRIFERFERVTENEAIKGFGLGLWIVRNIVEAHRGRIAVESQPGQGSTFTVSLPLTPRS
ncbi:MAG: PAS domain-containing sensor histidine kinase [Oligoflexia bacterium]|nr:PAS domain-containing sensor histidine kinase [Oligoflexia bacterium]